MNDQCHDCKIRKLCYLEEPEEDWTCDHYEPCEYDEEVLQPWEVLAAQAVLSQPELIEKAAYIRGFEQGRTQGMIDSQGGKK